MDAHMVTPDAIRSRGCALPTRPYRPRRCAPWVLDGLDLRVRRGEWLAVMGASDAGKTTLCLLLAGLAPHLTGGQMEGRIVVAGRDTRQHPPPALADTVGLLFQEPEAQLFNPTVETEVAWGLENLGLPAPRNPRTRGARCWPCSAWTMPATAPRPSCRAVRRNGWPWPRCWPCARPCSSSTSRWAGWTLSAATRCWPPLPPCAATARRPSS